MLHSSFHICKDTKRRFQIYKKVVVSLKSLTYFFAWNGSKEIFATVLPWDFPEIFNTSRIGVVFLF